MLPHVLVPFVESLDLTQLAEALRSRRPLYFHPAVRQQIAYLVQLQHDEREWERLGWAQTEDDDGRFYTPREVDRVNEALNKLIAAHAEAMLPNMELTRRRVRKRPGPRGGFPNPHPSDDSTTWIDPETMHGTWRIFRDAIEAEKVRSAKWKKLLARIPAQAPTAYVQRLVEFVRGIVADDLPEWSDRVEWRYDAGQEPPTNLTEGARFNWDLRHLPSPHTTVDFTPIIDEVLRDPTHRTRMERAGRASFLASAILAAYLDVSTTRVQTAIDNYERKPGSTPRRRTSTPRP